MHCRFFRCSGVGTKERPWRGRYLVIMSTNWDTRSIMNPEPRVLKFSTWELRRQNTVDVDVDGAVNQLRQGVEMAYDVVDVSVHFPRKDGAATYVHLYGSVHTHTGIFSSVFGTVTIQQQLLLLLPLCRIVTSIHKVRTTYPWRCLCSSTVRRICCRRASTNTSYEMSLESAGRVTSAMMSSTAVLVCGLSRRLRQA